MEIKSVYEDMIQLRNYSSAFSRKAFMDILNFDDYSRFDWIFSEYNLKSCDTYLKFLSTIYNHIRNKYRCEYVYKNELIRHLLKKYGTKNTVYFNEFKVGTSIADMVMFNGESKAFEIKTEYDSQKRLVKQMDNYRCLFDKIYLVIPESRIQDYIDSIEPTTGIIVMSRQQNDRVLLKEIKQAEINPYFKTEVMISCLRTSEYVNIAISLGADLKNVPGYDLFSYCKDFFFNCSTDELRYLFLQEIKKRKNNTSSLKKYPKSLRQMMLSLNLPDVKADVLMEKLSINIKNI